jgi:hypothetical protein
MTIKSIFALAIITASTLFMTGCLTAPKGYTLVESRPRVMATQLEIPSDTNVLRFAATRGVWDSDVMLEGIIVRKGAISFIGSNGSITFAPDNNVYIRVFGQQDQAFPLTARNIQFHLYENPIMDCRHMIKPNALKEFRMRNNNSPWQYSPELIANYHNKFWLIDIPYLVSEDFDGELGTLKIIPPEGGWNDFSDSCSRFLSK